MTGWWPWLGGLVAAVAALGPALAPGALLHLDLVLVPRIPFPSAMLGLGIDLPRRVPLGAPLSWMSEVVGGAWAGKAMLGLFVAAAFAGAVRLAAGAPVAARVGAGVLYAVGPFTMTRLAVGHWAVLAAMAVLPFALPRLLRPAADVRRTFLWSVAMGLTGVVGGVLALGAVTVGLVAERGRRALAVVPFVALAHVPWVVPGLLVRGGGLDLAGAQWFDTRGEGPFGVIGALLAGHGFWRAPSQVGGDPGLAGSIAGLGLLALAVAGTSRLPSPWGRRSAALAAVGFAVAAASAVPGVRALYADVTDLAPFSPLREGQRALVVFLVWLAPAAALGAARLAGALREARPLALALPAALAAVLAWPGLWGAEGRLDPVELPDDWARAKARVEQEPGTVLALPWHQYLDLDVAGGARVLHPVPDYFGGDVISSHDPELGGRVYQESVDRREARARTLDARMRAGAPVGDALADLGVDWVVLLHEVDWLDYAGLARDARLEAAVVGPTLTLYEVTGPTAPAPRDPLWKPVVAGLAHAATAGGVALALFRVGRRPGGRRWSRRAGGGAG